MHPLRRLPPRPRRSKQLSKVFDPNAFLTNAGIGRTIRRYKPKQAVFSQGDPAGAVFFIREGRVRLSVLSEHGKEATIALLGPGEFLGEGCIASNQAVRMATATAITDCSILKIDKKRMMRTLHEEHGLSDLFVVHMVERHNRTQADLVDQLFNSSGCPA